MLDRDTSMRMIAAAKYPDPLTEAQKKILEGFMDLESGDFDAALEVARASRELE